jgi:chitodextrinase
MATGAIIMSSATPAGALAASTLQNPSLETMSGTVPSCWKLGGYGTNSYTWTHTTDAHSGGYAENLTISSLTSGDRKLLSAFDSGTCAPGATAGATYTVGAWYKVPSGSAAPKFFAYYRSSSGSWTYWTESPKVSISSSWTHASWTTPALPSGATNISVGMGLTGVGSVTMDDFTLTQVGADTTAPTAPGNLSASAGAGKVALSWSASSDPDSSVAGYYVLRNGSKVAQVSGTGYTDTAVSNGTSYSYSVEAYDTAGNVSAASASVSATPSDTTAPSVPAGLSATPGNAQVALAWAASSDTDSSVAGYYVFRNGSQVGQATGTSYTDVSVSNGTSYSYYVEAYDPAGNVSAASGSVSAVPVAPAVSSACPNPGPQTTWTAPGTPPLTDAQAAACVVHQPETRPNNVQYDTYVPTDAELQAFHTATDDTGSLADSNIPERKAVTGRDGLSNPSTDDLIQWTAHKWGIPEDWIRAQMAVESWWNQTSLGDRATVSSSWYTLYPPQARVAGTSDVYETMGMSQIKWRPDGSVDAGTEPLRWESTAFAMDYYGAEIRYFYNGDCSWCGSGYSAGQQWPSIGAWFEPLPWGNSSAQGYIANVQNDLANRVWAQPGF